MKPTVYMLCVKNTVFLYVPEVVYHCALKIFTKKKPVVDLGKEDN
jgi:hypothetical protein